MSILAQIIAANSRPAPVSVIKLPEHLAMMFGFAPPYPRPTCAPVRKHRMYIANPAALPELPPANKMHPATLRATLQRMDVLQVLRERGQAMRRVDVSTETGIEESTVTDRLVELKKLGLVRMERFARTALWEAVEQGEDE